MKRPYYNEIDRYIIYCGGFTSLQYRIKLRILKILRSWKAQN